MVLKAGRQLVRALQENTDISLKGFIDDDLSQQGCKWMGN